MGKPRMAGMQEGKRLSQPLMALWIKIGERSAEVRLILGTWLFGLVQ